MEYTIVITTYNDSSEIGDLLNNIISFRRKPKEIIIADGGSKDDTVAIATEYSKEYPVRVVTNGRLNISQGLNLAISECRTEAVMICATGNDYDLDYSDCCMKSIEDGADVCYGVLKGRKRNWVQINYNRSFLGGEKGIIPEIASNHGTIIRKAIFEQCGGFLENFVRAGEDTEYYKYLKHENKKITTVSSTSVTWDVPKSLKEFYYQIKWYTIASMQLNPAVDKRKILLSKVIRYLVLFGVAVSIAFVNIWLFIAFLAGIAAIMLCDFRILRIFFRDFIIVKYRKYMNPEYTVTRNKKHDA